MIGRRNGDGDFKTLGPEERKVDTEGNNALDKMQQFGCRDVAEKEWGWINQTGDNYSRLYTTHAVRGVRVSQQVTSELWNNGNRGVGGVLGYQTERAKHLPTRRGDMVRCTIGIEQ